MNDEEELEIGSYSSSPYFFNNLQLLTWFIYRIQDTEYEQYKADMHGVTSFRL